MRAVRLFFAFAAFTAMSPRPVRAEAAPFRLTAEEVRDAAFRVDQVVITMERTQQEAAVKRFPEEKIPPFTVPPLVDDATFVRRAYLDLQGRNPEPEMVRSFLLDLATDKRLVLVDRLLSESWSDTRRFLQLADMLRVKDSVLGLPLRPYISWLQDASATMPYDQMVRKMITASGSVDGNPATGYLLSDAGEVTITMAETMRVFLNEDLHCARCHDHPFSDWTQMQFYQMSAMLGGAHIQRTGLGKVTSLWPEANAGKGETPALAAGESLVVTDLYSGLFPRLPRGYLYRDGKPGDVVTPAFPLWKGDEIGGMRTYNGQKMAPEKLRQEFADGVINNRRFAEVAALRVWQRLFGVPAQTPGATAGPEQKRTMAELIKTGSCDGPGIRNAAWNPGYAGYLRENADVTSRAFLTTLADEMVRVGYDLREFERILGHTYAYQRRAQILERNGSPGLMLAPALRRLPAETLWNNLALVCNDGALPGTMPYSSELPQVQHPEHPASILGWSKREWGDDSQPLITHEMARMAINGEAVKDAAASQSALVRRLSKTPAPDDAVEEAFLRVLGRLPSHREKMAALEHVRVNQESGWGDMVWALLNTREFLFQR